MNWNGKYASGSVNLDAMANIIIDQVRTNGRQLLIQDPEGPSNFWVPESRPEFRFIINRTFDGISSRTLDDLINLLRAYTAGDSRYQLLASDKYTLFENGGIFDISSGRSVAKTNAMFSYMVPHSLNLKASSSVVDDFLKRISCGDQLIEKTILAMGGAAITGYNPAGRLFFLLDEGFGGSGIIEKLLLSILGEDAVSTLMLAQFGQRFYPAAIKGKRANLGAIGCTEIPTLTKDIVKTIAKGTLPVTLEQKGVPVSGETVAPILIFHGDELPTVQGKDNWFTAKTIAIPFRSDILAGDDGMESRYIRALSTEAALQALIRRMLREIHIVLKTGEFPVPQQSEEELTRLKLKQNPVLAYIKAEGRRASDFEEIPISAAAEDINSFLCKHEVEPLDVRAISKDLRKIFPSLGVKPIRLKGSDSPCKCFYQKGGVDLVR